MTVLPIRLISEIDQPIFGANLFNLAKLQRDNSLVAEGVAISPPEAVLDTVLKYFQDVKREVFEQQLTIVKKEVFRIPLPEELDKELEGKRNYYFRGKKFIKKQELWEGLINFWLEVICSRIWKEGFTQNLTAGLPSQAVFFFIESKFLEAVAYLDPELEEVVIKSAEKVEPGILRQIDEQVLKANKRLVLPQIYQFLIVDKKLKLVGVYPFTQTLPASKAADVVLPKGEQKQLIKSAVKLFLNLSQGFTAEGSIDGVLIEGEKVGNLENKLEWFETMAFKLAESALSFPQAPVIFKLPDIKNGEIRGARRLLDQESLLKAAAEVFAFVRNKKTLFNLELAIPLSRSVEEFLQLKRKLAEKGLERKGNLKYWWEVVVPENLINLEDYLAAGFDGVILNLDELQKFLGGYDLAEGEYYKRQVQTLIRFLKPSFKVLHQAKVPVLAKGELNIHHEVLEFLIEAGVWGIVVNTALEAENLPEHLSWAEKRMVIKKLGD